MATKKKTPSPKKVTSTQTNKLKSKRKSQTKSALQEGSLLPIPLPYDIGEGQALAIPKLSNALAQVDNVISGAIAANDITPAINLLKATIETQRITGIILAKSLWMLSTAWANLAASEGVSFIEYIHEQTGHSGDTIRQYILVWTWHQELGDNVPQEVKESLLLLPMTAQVQLAKFSREHGKFTLKQLKSFVAGGGTEAIKQIIKTIRTGKDAPTHVGISGKIDADGNLTVYVDDSVVDLGVIQKPDGVGAEVDAADRAWRWFCKKLGIDPDKEPGE